MLYPPLEERYWLWKLQEGDESEKERAADRLAELGVEEAIPILVSLIPRESPSGVSRDGFIWNKIAGDLWVRALVKRKGASVPYLREILKEKSVLARSYAVYILGNIGPPAMEAVPEILEAVRTGPDRTSVWIAHESLKQISPKAAKELTARHRFLVETGIR